MDLDGALRDIQQFCYLLAALAGPDQVGYLDLGLREVGIGSAQLMQERRDYLVQTGLDDAYVRFLDIAHLRILQPLDVGHDELSHIGVDGIFER